MRLPIWLWCCCPPPHVYWCALGIVLTHTNFHNFHPSWHSLLLEGVVLPNQAGLLHGVLVYITHLCLNGYWYWHSLFTAFSPMLDEGKDADVNLLYFNLSSNNVIISVILHYHCLFNSFSRQEIFCLSMPQLILSPSCSRMFTLGESNC
jgi:hypothetical protein